MINRHFYTSKEYAESFSFQGYKSVELNDNGIWLLERPIPGTNYFDLMGCYPLTTFDRDDNFSYSGEAISMTMVSDIFSQPEISELSNQFDYVQFFKPHYYIDFSKEITFSDHHKYEIKRALKKGCIVKRVALSEVIEEWNSFYSNLISRHNITGIQTFHPKAFDAIKNSDKLVTFAVYHEDKPINLHICIIHNQYAYSHLNAASELSYKLGASYLVYDAFINYFKDNGYAAIDVGGGAGVNETSNGMTKFKQGFSNAEKDCYICGKVLNENVYNQLSKDKVGAFFPLYRAK